MVTKEKVKMCPFCEGSIPMDATDCNFCGSSLTKSSFKKAEMQESLASLYDPPYSPSKTSRRYGVFTQQESQADDDFEEDPPPAVEKKAKVKSDDKDRQESASLGALLLLSIGGQLFTLAWLLFFFSDHGRLMLEWRSRYWPLYLIVSVPLLYQGWKRVVKI